MRTKARRLLLLNDRVVCVAVAGRPSEAEFIPPAVVTYIFVINIDTYLEMKKEILPFEMGNFLPFENEKKNPFQNGKKIALSISSYDRKNPLLLLTYCLTISIYILLFEILHFIAVMGQIRRSYFNFSFSYLRDNAKRQI